MTDNVTEWNELKAWNHNICPKCFDEMNAGCVPAAMRNAPAEYCCFCNRITRAGIYVRVDPSKMTCTHSGPAATAPDYAMDPRD